MRVVSSLAGRVRDPALPAGEVRIGGFGGVDGLAAWLRDHDVAAVVDATHPFASTMTAHAVDACAATGVPLVVLRRPGWPAEPGWVWADSLAAAAALLPSLGKRVFLTTGRTSLAAFAELDLEFLVRCVDPPSGPMPRRARVLLDRGPFTVDGERALMREHGVDVLVTKDSGGPLTSAKLAAARDGGRAGAGRAPAPAADRGGGRRHGGGRPGVARRRSDRPLRVSAAVDRPLRVVAVGRGTLCTPSTGVSGGSAAG